MASPADQTVGEPPLPSVSVKPANVVVVPSDKLVFTLESGAPEGKAKAKAHLVIHNPTDESVIFKFKTNADKASVGVRPCSGHVHSGEHADVDVTLDYAAKEDLTDLKLLVVTAPAPKNDYDLKTVWPSIAHEQQTVTKVMCVVNTDPSPQHKSCFIGKVPTPTGPPDNSHLMQTFGESKCYKGDSSRSAGSNGGGGYAPRVDYQNYCDMLDKQQPQSLMSQARPKMFAAMQHQQGHENSRFQGSMHPEPMQQQQRPSQTRQNTEHSYIPQPLLSYEQPMEADQGEDNSGYYQGQQQQHQSRKPTSYFVDVSPIAERELKAAAGSSSFFLGMDRNNLVQVGLLAVAGIAATKLFFE